MSFDTSDAILPGLWLGLASATAIVAGFKGRSVVAWLLASLLAPGIGLVRVLVAPQKKAGEALDWTTFTLGMAATPLLVATVAVYVGSLSNRSSEYWLVAPWFIIAAIPVSAFMLLLVGLLYWMTGGGRSQANDDKQGAR